MKIRFNVDVQQCLIDGIDCQGSAVTIDLCPSDLTQEDRKLLAALMWAGAVICEVDMDFDEIRPLAWREEAPAEADPRPAVITAAAPNIEALMDSVRKQHKRHAGRKAAQ